MVVEEEDDMMIAEETIQAATLILADAIDEIQTGDLPQKMISERLQQVCFHAPYRFLGLLFKKLKPISRPL